MVKEYKRPRLKRQWPGVGTTVKTIIKPALRDGDVFLFVCLFVTRHTLVWKGILVAAMLCKRGLCRHAVCVCVCVSVTFVHSVKTNKLGFKIFSPSGSHTSLVFPYQTAWQYSDGNPLTGASNAGGVDKKRDSEPISGFTACC